MKENRRELFNLKNKDCQERFKGATKGVNNNQFLSSVFDEDDGLNTLTKKFLKRLHKTIQKCFKKVRITERNDEVKDDLFLKWKELKKKSDKDSIEELEKVENELADKYDDEIPQSKGKQAVNSLRENSFQVAGPRLFNCLPKSLREINKSSKLEFKEQLNLFLATLPDHPNIGDITPNICSQVTAKPSNSLVDVILHKKLSW